MYRRTMLPLRTSASVARLVAHLPSSAVLLRSLALVGVCLVSLACGDDAAATGAPADGKGDPPARDPSCPAVPALVGYLTVEAEQTLNVGGKYATYASQSFGRGVTLFGTSHTYDAYATPEAVGACQLYRLSASCQPSTEASSAAFINIGDVTITSPSNGAWMFPTDATTLALAGRGDAAPFFKPGDAVRFSGGGTVFPAFDGTVVAPAALSVTAPTASDKASRSTGLEVAFTGGGSGVLEIELSGEGGDKLSPRAFCRFPASEGKGTVPSAVVQAVLPAGGGKLIVGFESLAEQRVTLDGAAVDLVVEGSAGLSADATRSGLSLDVVD